MILNNFNKLCVFLIFLLSCDFVCNLKLNQRGACRTKQTVVKKNCKPVWRCKVTQFAISCCNGWQYKKNTDECIPLCQPICQGGGVCVAPNKCKCESPKVLTTDGTNNCILTECESGYYRPTEHDECIPECTITCENGVIDKINCNCTCNHGYTYNGTDTTSCTKSVCTDECVNSDCTLPDTCTCWNGYEKTDRHHVCDPVCKETCVNGKCTKPDHCECYDGYLKDVNGVCVPVCTPECSGGGICVGPNVCQCTTPKVLSSDKVNTCTMPKCENGYHRLSESDECVPVCKDGCINSNCTSPNECTCWDNYSKNGTNSCTPTCTPECTNGVCLSPNFCQCNQGYEKNFHNSCTPICTAGCEYGICTRPDICECNEGYQFNSTTNKCEPICINCINGYCTSPYKCTCNDGYRKKNDSDTCTPHCKEKCINGECTSPNTCTCHDGYGPLSENNLCPPVCMECINGVCISPGKCECKKGFVKLDDNICVLKCHSVTGANCKFDSVKEEEYKREKASTFTTWPWITGEIFGCMILVIVVGVSYKGCRRKDTRTSTDNKTNDNWQYKAVMTTNDESLIKTTTLPNPSYEDNTLT